MMLHRSAKAEEAPRSAFYVLVDTELYPRRTGRFASGENQPGWGHHRRAGRRRAAAVLTFVLTIVVPAPELRAELRADDLLEPEAVGVHAVPARDGLLDDGGLVVHALHLVEHGLETGVGLGLEGVEDGAVVGFELPLHALVVVRIGYFIVLLLLLLVAISNNSAFALLLGISTLEPGQDGGVERGEPGA
ncbi:uncharacterized protein PG986_010507 [Apiospora aurea]|uniref:Uncharacterized protein n=1 Tax=Apiospora aurea TaxID=335848 RepID=A0ABR1Q2F6_9PEZI